MYCTLLNKQTTEDIFSEELLFPELVEIKYKHWLEAMIIGL